MLSEFKSTKKPTKVTVEYDELEFVRNHFGRFSRRIISKPYPGGKIAFYSGAKYAPMFGVQNKLVVWDAGEDKYMSDLIVTPYSENELLLQSTTNNPSVMVYNPYSDETNPSNFLGDDYVIDYLGGYQAFNVDGPTRFYVVSKDVTIYDTDGNLSVIPIYLDGEIIGISDGIVVKWSSTGSVMKSISVDNFDPSAIMLSMDKTTGLLVAVFGDVSSTNDVVVVWIDRNTLNVVRAVRVSSPSWYGQTTSTLLNGYVPIVVQDDNDLPHLVVIDQNGNLTKDIVFDTDNPPTIGMSAFANDHLFGIMYQEDTGESVVSLTYAVFDSGFNLKFARSLYGSDANLTSDSDSQMSATFFGDSVAVFTAWWLSSDPNKSYFGLLFDNGTFNLPSNSHSLEITAPMYNSYGEASDFTVSPTTVTLTDEGAPNVVVGDLPPTAYGDAIPLLEIIK